MGGVQITHTVLFSFSCSQFVFLLFNNNYITRKLVSLFASKQVYRFLLFFLLFARLYFLFLLIHIRKLPEKNVVLVVFMLILEHYHELQWQK